MSGRSSASVKVVVSAKVRTELSRFARAGNYASESAFVEEAIREKLQRARNEQLAPDVLEGLRPQKKYEWNAALAARMEAEVATRARGKRGRKAKAGGGK